MSANFGNTSEDATFRSLVQNWFSLCRNEKLTAEKEILIGVPPCPHKYDLANSNLSVVVECRNYKWPDDEDTLNMQISLCNEAVLYLRLLPTNCEKWLVLRKDYDPKRMETLATYYYKKNRHILGDVSIAEFDCENDKFCIVGRPEQACIVCGMGYTLNQLDNTTDQEFAVFRMHHMPKKLYKYFPNTTTYKDGVEINYSIEALKNNTVYLQSPKYFDDPYDSSIVIDEMEFYQRRIKHYLDICSVQYVQNEDISTLVYKLAQKIYDQSRDGKTMEEIFGISSALEEIDSLRRSVFGLHLEEKLQKYKDDPDAWQHAIYDSLRHELESINSNLVNRFRVSCFTTTPYLMLMWAHYANSHQGFCLEYEIPEYEEVHAELLHRLYPVIYSPRRTSVLDYCVRDLDTNCHGIDTLWQIHKYGLLAKDILWQYQNEWRLIFYDKMLEADNAYNYRFFKISKVYLGSKMSPEKRREIIDICKMHDIPYVGVKTDFSTYTMCDCAFDCEECPNGRIK